MVKKYKGANFSFRKQVLKAQWYEKGGGVFAVFVTENFTAQNTAAILASLDLTRIHRLALGKL